MQRFHSLWLLVGLAAVAASSSAMSSAWGQAYPTRPVRVIVSAAAGGPSDVIGRIVAQKLSERLGQQFYVENIPAGAGNVAVGMVAKAAPDGYTLLLSTNSPLSSNPFLLKSIAYDPVKDFAAITRVGSFTNILVANPAVPVKTLGEVIAYARANPGTLSYASGNTSGILAGETLKHTAGVDILHVPYKSVPPALNDVIAGRVSMAFTDLTPSLPHVGAGTLRAIAITRLQRSVLLPDLPTFEESGLTGFEVESWAGLFAPAGTPADIIARLNTETRKVIDNPAVKAQIAQIGFEVFGSTPEALAEFVKVQLAKTGRMVADAGIEPE
jgi:tripartite-type tricarboxylate transporter receptor subunit TctC